MILDYPEQELIWRLTGTHPYIPNSSSTSHYLRYSSDEEYESLKNQIVARLKPEQIIEIKDRIIYIRTVFGGVSTLWFTHDYKDSDDKRNTE